MQHYLFRDWEWLNHKLPIRADHQDRDHYSQIQALGS